MADLRLAELIAARLCHDFASPMVAVSGGAGMLAGSVPPSPELDLIAQAAEEATARLKLMRLAFGPDPGTATVPGDLRAALAGLSGRAQVDWTAPFDAPRAEVRIALLCLLALEPALPRGGLLSVEAVGGFWRIAASGAGLRPDGVALETLMGGEGTADARPSFLPALMAAHLAAAAGRRIMATAGEVLVLTF